MDPNRWPIYVQGHHPGYQSVPPPRMFPPHFDGRSAHNYRFPQDFSYGRQRPYYRMQPPRHRSRKPIPWTQPSSLENEFKYKNKPPSSVIQPHLHSSEVQQSVTTQTEKCEPSIEPHKLTTQLPTLAVPSLENVSTIESSSRTQPAYLSTSQAQPISSEPQLATFEPNPSSSGIQSGRPPEVEICLIDDDEDDDVQVVTEVKPGIKREDVKPLIACVDLCDELDSPEEQLNRFQYNTATKILLPICGTQDEGCFIEALHQFKLALENQMMDIKLPYELMNLLTKYLLFLGINYRVIGNNYIDEYLELMEDILVLYCQVVSELILSPKEDQRKQNPKRIAARIKYLIARCLLYRLDSVMHCLFKVHLYPSEQDHSHMWTDVFVFFLKKARYQLKKNDLFRVFIAWQKFKTLRLPTDANIIDNLMRVRINRSMNELKAVPQLREVIECMQNQTPYSFRDMLTRYWRWWKEERRTDILAELEEPTIIDLPGRADNQCFEYPTSSISSEGMDEIGKLFEDRRLGRSPGLTQLAMGKRNAIGYFPLLPYNVFDGDDVGEIAVQNVGRSFWDHFAALDIRPKIVDIIEIKDEPAEVKEEPDDVDIPLDLPNTDTASSCTSCTASSCTASTSTTSTSTTPSPEGRKPSNDQNKVAALIPDGEGVTPSVVHKPAEKLDVAEQCSIPNTLVPHSVCPENSDEPKEDSTIGSVTEDASISKPIDNFDDDLYDEMNFENTPVVFDDISKDSKDTSVNADDKYVSIFDRRPTMDFWNTDPFNLSGSDDEENAFADNDKIGNKLRNVSDDIVDDKVTSKSANLVDNIEMEEASAATDLASEQSPNNSSIKSRNDSTISANLSANSGKPMDCHYDKANAPLTSGTCLETSRIQKETQETDSRTGTAKTMLYKPNDSQTDRLTEVTLDKPTEVRPAKSCSPIGYDLASEQSPNNSVIQSRNGSTISANLSANSEKPMDEDFDKANAPLISDACLETSSTPKDSHQTDSRTGTAKTTPYKPNDSQTDRLTEVNLDKPTEVRPAKSCSPIGFDFASEQSPNNSVIQSRNDSTTSANLSANSEKPMDKDYDKKANAPLISDACLETSSIQKKSQQIYIRTGTAKTMPYKPNDSQTDKLTEVTPDKPTEVRPAKSYSPIGFFDALEEDINCEDASVIANDRRTSRVSSGSSYKAFQLDFWSSDISNSSAWDDEENAVDVSTSPGKIKSKKIADSKVDMEYQTVEEPTSITRNELRIGETSKPTAFIEGIPAVTEPDTRSAIALKEQESNSFRCVGKSDVANKLEVNKAGRSQNGSAMPANDNADFEKPKSNKVSAVVCLETSSIVKENLHTKPTTENVKKTPGKAYKTQEFEPFGVTPVKSSSRCNAAGGFHESDVDDLNLEDTPVIFDVSPNSEDVQVNEQIGIPRIGVPFKPSIGNNDESFGFGGSDDDEYEVDDIPTSPDRIKAQVADILEKMSEVNLEANEEDREEHTIYPADCIDSAKTEEASATAGLKKILNSITSEQKKENTSVLRKSKLTNKFGNKEPAGCRSLSVVLKKGTEMPKTLEGKDKDDTSEISNESGNSDNQQLDIGLTGPHIHTKFVEKVDGKIDVKIRNTTLPPCRVKENRHNTFKLASVPTKESQSDPPAKPEAPKKNQGNMSTSVEKYMSELEKNTAADRKRHRKHRRRRHSSQPQPENCKLTQESHLGIEAAAAVINRLTEKFSDKTSIGGNVKLVGKVDDKLEVDKSPKKHLVLANKSGAGILGKPTVVANKPNAIQKYTEKFPEETSFGGNVKLVGKVDGKLEVDKSPKKHPVLANKSEALGKPTLISSRPNRSQKHQSKHLQDSNSVRSKRSIEQNDAFACRHMTFVAEKRVKLDNTKAAVVKSSEMSTTGSSGNGRESGEVFSEQVSAFPHKVKLSENVKKSGTTQDISIEETAEDLSNTNLISGNDTLSKVTVRPWEVVDKKEQQARKLSVMAKANVSPKQDNSQDISLRKRMSKLPPGRTLHTRAYKSLDNKHKDTKPNQQASAKNKSTTSSISDNDPSLYNTNRCTGVNKQSTLSENELEKTVERDKQGLGNSSTNVEAYGPEKSTEGDWLSSISPADLEETQEYSDNQNSVKKVSSSSPRKKNPSVVAPDKASSWRRKMSLSEAVPTETEPFTYSTSFSETTTFSMSVDIQNLRLDVETDDARSVSDVVNKISCHEWRETEDDTTVTEKEKLNQTGLDLTTYVTVTSVPASAPNINKPSIAVLYENLVKEVQAEEINSADGLESLRNTSAVGVDVASPSFQPQIFLPLVDGEFVNYQFDNQAPHYGTTPETPEGQDETERFPRSQSYSPPNETLASTDVVISPRSEISNTKDSKVSEPSLGSNIKPDVPVQTTNQKATSSPSGSPVTETRCHSMLFFEEMAREIYVNEFGSKLEEKDIQNLSKRKEANLKDTQATKQSLKPKRRVHHVTADHEFYPAATEGTPVRNNGNTESRSGSISVKSETQLCRNAATPLKISTPKGEKRNKDKYDKVPPITKELFIYIERSKIISDSWTPGLKAENEKRNRLIQEEIELKRQKTLELAREMELRGQPFGQEIGIIYGVYSENLNKEHKHSLLKHNSPRSANKVKFQAYTEDHNHWDNEIDLTAPKKRKMRNEHDRISTPKKGRQPAKKHSDNPNNLHSESEVPDVKRFNQHGTNISQTKSGRLSKTPRKDYYEFTESKRGRRNSSNSF